MGMWANIKKFFEFSAKIGLFAPMLYDHTRRKPSVTLLFAYSAHFVALGGLIALLQKNLTLGVLGATGYSVAMIALYLMRHLSAFKVDIKEGEFSASGQEPEKKEET
jgi:hypothetical protein